MLSLLDILYTFVHNLYILPSLNYPCIPLSFYTSSYITVHYHNMRRLLFFSDLRPGCRYTVHCIVPFTVSFVFLLVSTYMACSIAFVLI
jgi:hypothetical protein